MPRKNKHQNKAKIKNPLPKWIDNPKVSGYYWFWDAYYEDSPPDLCEVEVDHTNGETYVLVMGSEQDFPIEQIGTDVLFCGPIDVPLSPFLTEGLSEYSVVGSVWAYDADRSVIRHLRNHTEIDLEQDCYSGWLLWLREEEWFATYMEEELKKFCELYAPKKWMR